MSTTKRVIATVASVLAFANAATYTVTVDQLGWDMGQDISDIGQIYVYVGAHTSNGSLVDGATTDFVDVDQAATWFDRIDIDSAHTFNDTDNQTIAELFFTLYFNLTNGTEYIGGYANKIYQIPADVCTLDVSDKSYMWLGTYDNVATLYWSLEQTSGSCELIPDWVTDEPTSTEDPGLTDTVETCQVISYWTDYCHPHSDSVSLTREYYAYCEDKCGEDHLLRTGPIGGYGNPECGKEPIWPHGVYERPCQVTDCDIGMFRFGDGVGAQSLVLSVLMGIIAILNQ